MKRVFDIVFSFVSLVLLSVPLLIISLCIKTTSRGSILYWSERVGFENKIYKMPKFRTMKIDTPVVATHLLKEPERHLTLIGGLLRKTSLDELPQLLCVLKGDMSIVGPRPALFNQYDLIELRTKRGIHRCYPGITGWAQVNGRDEISIPDKVLLDEYYLNKQSFLLDLRIILLTLYNVVRIAGVSH